MSQAIQGPGGYQQPLQLGALQPQGYGNPWAQGIAMGQALQVQQHVQSQAMSSIQATMLEGINQLGGMVADIQQQQFATMVAGVIFFQHPGADRSFALACLHPAPGGQTSLCKKKKHYNPMQTDL